MSIRAALHDVAEVWRSVGEFDVTEFTPGSVNPPSVFAGALESMETDEQDGSRTLTFPWWVVVTAGQPNQDELYDAIDALFSAMDDPDTGVENARIASVDSVGVVAVGGVDYEGARLMVEVFL